MRFFRLASPTQTPEVAALQVESGEIWGQRNAHTFQAIRPSVDAYVGSLPVGADGIEFETEVEPDPGQPPGRARWTGPRDGVVVEGEWAKIQATIVRTTQLKDPS